MLDTVRCQWASIDFGREFCDWLKGEYVQAEFHTQFYDRGKETVMSMIPWQGATVKDDVLGVLQIKSNMMGNWLIAERSLPKFMYGDNCRVLSLAETVTGLSAWLNAVEEKFRPWFPPLLDLRSARKIQRADLCYQQKVPCSVDVFHQIGKTVNAKKVVQHKYVLCPMQEHRTGLTMKRSALELTRWYDKGVESGNESYLDVVRQEEQMRRGKAGFLVDISGDVPLLNVTAARDQMNRVYSGWGSLGAVSGQLEGYPVSDVLREHGAIGGAAVALVESPHLEPAFQQAYSESMYYRALKLAREIRKRNVTIDLTLPDDAWCQPMVL